MIKPLEDRVIIKMIEDEEKTKSGIILSQNNKEKTQIAEVLEVGPGKKENGEFIDMYIKVGDKVFINKYAGTEIKYEDNNLIIIKQNEILARIEE